jgi:hypothetical protein
MITFDVTSVVLVAIVAAVMALFFDYFPWVAKAFDSLDEGVKRLIILGATFITAVIIFIGGCLGFFVVNIACTNAGGLAMFMYFLEAIGFTQITHLITKPTDKMRAEMFGLKRGRK